MPRPTSPGGPSLKTLLRASEALLKPPQPLPSSPPELLQRLKGCSKLLPKEWKKSCSEWNEEDELEQIGDNAPTGLPSGSAVSSEVEQRRKRRKEELLFVVGKRCFALIKAIQGWLRKEFWPKDQRGGMEQRDFLLGTADLRLIRLMVSHTTFSYLLPLTSNYARSLPDYDPTTAATLSSVIESLLDLLRTASPPRPAAGPSSQSPIPPTAITENLISSHLMPIFLSTVILAYTPSTPSEKYSNLRKSFLHVLMGMTPGFAISTLVNVLKLLTQGRRQGVKPNGWVREWPKYPDGFVNGLLTSQMRRPGGVRGLMENVLGETAKTDDIASIDGKRLDHIFNLLVRIPRESTSETYYPWLLSELFSMIPLTDDSSHHPVAFVNTACYSIQRLLSTDRPLIEEWLRNKLHSPWYPKSGESSVATSWEAIQRSIQNMRLLLIHNPSSPQFADFLVGSVLPPLFSLHTFLSRKQPPKKAGNRITVIDKQNGTNETATNQNLSDDVAFLLKSWGKTVSDEDGVKGIWSIVEGGTGWGKDPNSSFFWEKEAGGGVRLMAGSPHGFADTFSEPDVILPPLSASSEKEEEHLAQLLLARTQATPDPNLLCQFIKGINRPDVASEVILKSLDLWRVRTATEVEPSMDSLLNLQLTIQMMEQLGNQLFTKPDQVLGFVERVLNDQVQALDEAEVKSQSKLNANSLIVEVNGDSVGDLDDDVAPDGKRGLIEVACQLLASLEAEGQLDKSNLTILRPIAFHLNELSTRSPSVSIRNGSREARLLLLAHEASKGDMIEPSSDSGQSAAEVYKQALDLTKDTNLPVRAHGLVMLKELVYSLNCDSTLNSSILNVFIKNIEDDESFIYLSAVKGLSGMVDVLGKDIFERVMSTYRTGIDGLKGDAKEDKLDKVLRIGEVLDQIIDRAGETLSNYANEIVPTLMGVFPDSSLPTIVRSSALSLLTSCATTSYLAIVPWSHEIAEAAIDLVQLESVSSSPFRPSLESAQITPSKPVNSGFRPRRIQLVEDEEPEPALEEEVSVTRPRIVDEDPIKKGDSKHPTLRRAALVLLKEVLGVMGDIAMSKIVSESDSNTNGEIDFQIRTKVDMKEPTLFHGQKGTNKSLFQGKEDNWQIPTALIDRAENVLRYVVQTDEDEIVRGHAESIVDNLDVIRLMMTRVNEGSEDLELGGRLKGLRLV
ncbi:hypothetical protein CI109_101976 [Kwoniella shandongensis]|uniref:Uncharacterized protein n=1 Tax=Kwoniella shandongensis TaxID=1734106 RepID=A0A5M6BTU4_9TREE|nr:uncharacterized protein CI109_005361 [Kwoniella shandongensis]KAA5526237.1 hypothetical protein CI109_005361 [Kwoniella shandongensis]